MSSSGKTAKDKPVRYFKTAADFEKWLRENAGDPDHIGIWLKIAKKDSEVPGPSYLEALKVALCYGWIDGQAKKLDDNMYIQSFTPRRKRSPWSKRNVLFVGELIQDGRMAQEGLDEIQRAKEDGRWEKAYEGSSTAKVPADFLRAIEDNPEASKTYKTLGSQSLFHIYYQLQDAKLPETRSKRIKKFVDQLASGSKPN